jgi:hypothetical protein
MTASAGTLSPRTGHRLAFLALLLATACVALFVLVLPFPHSFSITDSYRGDLYSRCSGIDTTKGDAVSFSWTTSNRTTFGVWSCTSSSIFYWANGTSGSGAFVSDGGVYGFGSLCGVFGDCWPANVTGEVSYPILRV